MLDISTKSLSANPTKWSNKMFDHFVKLALKVLTIKEIKLFHCTCQLVRLLMNLSLILEKFVVDIFRSNVHFY